MRDFDTFEEDGHGDETSGKSEDFYEISDNDSEIKINQGS